MNHEMHKLVVPLIRLYKMAMSAPRREFNDDD